MKKISFVILLAILSITTTNAQGNVQFGVTGGLINGSGNISIGGINIGNILQSVDVNVLDGTGFFIGALVDIEATKKLHVQPELLYAGIGGEGALLIPIMAKYYVGGNFNLQAGPQLDYVLNIPSIAEPLVKEFGLSLGIGAGFDINDDFAVQAKYTFGLTDRLEDVLNNIISSSLKIDTFQIGLVYNFN